MRQSFTIARLLTTWILWLVGIALTLPALGQGYVDDGKRYAMYTIYHYSDADGSTERQLVSSMNDAFDKGCNSVVIGIAWDVLQPSINNAPDWGYVDRMVQVALKRNVKIALRLRTTRPLQSGVWADEQSIRDTRGRVMQQGDVTHVRLGYTPAIDRIQDFVRAAAQRYKYLNDQGNLLFMSVTFDPQWENEYWFMNTPGDYPTSYDYNELTIGDFQRWSVAKYGSLDAVNKAWGSGYKAVTDIRPTYPDAKLQGGYVGKRGADWYVFRHVQLKSFNDRFSRTVKSVDPAIRVITEQGSVYDIMSGNRGTLGFKSLAETADGIKVNDGLEYIHQFSMDLLRSNQKPGAWVVNEVDGSQYLSDHIDRSNEQADMIENSFKYGAKIVTFANFFAVENGAYLKAILDKVKARGILDKPVATVTSVGTMTYKLSSVVQTNIFESGALGQWNTLRGSDLKPVRILIDEDLLTGTTPTPLQNQPPTVANRVPNQTALLNKPFSFKIPDNTFADADGQITGVAVSGLPTGLSYNPATRTISGTPTLIGTSEIAAVATDNNNASVNEFFVVTVKRATLPLQLLDPLVDCNTGRFEFRSTEGDGSIIEYALDNIYSLNTQTIYTLAGQYRSGSTLIVRAKQSGTEIVLSYTTTCPAPVTSTNKPPVVNIPMVDQGVTMGKSLLVLLPANMFTDPDGTIASVGLSGMPPGITYYPASRILEGYPTSAGTWTVTAMATDNEGATVSTTFRVLVYAAPVTKPLRLLAPVLDCATGRFEFQSADGDGTSIDYAADNLYYWNTQQVYTLADQYRYGAKMTLRARQSGTEVTLTYSTTCPTPNKPPVVVTPIANQGGTVNKGFLVIIPAGTFADPDGQITSIDLSGLPPGIAFTSATRIITGTASLTGLWTVTATATDDKGATVSTTFTIVFGREIKPLRLLEPVLDCATGLLEFITADGDGTQIDYSADGGARWSLLTSLTLAADQRYNKQLNIQARQSGQVVTSQYSPTCLAPNQLPVVKTAVPNQSLVQYRTTTFQVPAATFDDADGTIDAIGLTGLPPGLIYVASNQTMSGAPTSLGSWTLTATATDNRGGTVTTTFVITVVADAKPIRLLSPLFDCNTGRLEFKTADGDGTAIGYSVDKVFDWTSQTAYTLADGLRYGTPLTLRIRQSGTEQTITFNTTCVRPNKPPVVTTPIANQVLIVNQPASVTLAPNTFTDPDGTITSVTLTGLPVGLSYNPTKRTIQGTPTLIGTSPAIAKATDNDGASVSDTFLITVRAPPRFAVTTTLLDVQGKILKELVDADLLDSKKMPILANLSCQPKVAAGGLLMELTGKAKRTVYANAAPYLLYPAGQGFKPDVGSYQMKVSVFSGANGTGSLLGTTIVRFDVVIANEGGSAPPDETGK